MGKKQKSRHQFDEFNDKPAYAADFLELNRAAKSGVKSRQGSSGKPSDKPETSEEAAAQLRDRLNEKTMQQLAQLKATMKEQELQQRGGAGVRESRETGATGEATRIRTGTARGGINTGFRRKSNGDDFEKEKSFKELFDPEPETDESFSDLFKDSKLDWRGFK